MKPLERRRAGILLHPSSLPGPLGGDLGPAAYHFVDFLAGAGLSLWQVLPLGPTHEDRSPYQCLSVHAGNPGLLSFELMRDWGWLAPSELPAEEPDDGRRRALVSRAWGHFRDQASAEDRQRLAAFVHRQSHWLEDYALFKALRERHRLQPWWHWPAGERDRDPAVLGRARGELQARIQVIRFEQFAFFRQWGALRDYARGRGVHLFGDLPIFVALDSADVWARRRNFLLDAAARPTLVAGVPPDYFSRSGQRWGNPLYDWEWMQADGFRWWLERMDTQLQLFDLVRIDHFRGFQACWAIPAAERSAVNGHWLEVDGDALFRALKERFGELPLVAEDLGHITEPVHALRRRWGLPGMKVLQFAFDGDPANPYLPHNHESDCVVYTGTHDNDTSLGWWQDLKQSSRRLALEYLGCGEADMPWALIRAALASPGRLAVVPMQDVLGLGAGHRMNTPGRPKGNWGWRFEWGQVMSDTAVRLRRAVEIYGRLAGEGSTATVPGEAGR